MGYTRLVIIIIMTRSWSRKFVEHAMFSFQYFLHILYKTIFQQLKKFFIKFEFNFLSESHNNTFSTNRYWYLLFPSPSSLDVKLYANINNFIFHSKFPYSYEVILVWEKSFVIHNLNIAFQHRKTLPLPAPCKTYRQSAWHSVTSQLGTVILIVVLWEETLFTLSKLLLGKNKGLVVTKVDFTAGLDEEVSKCFLVQYAIFCSEGFFNLEAVTSGDIRWIWKFSRASRDTYRPLGCQFFLLFFSMYTKVCMWK